MVCWPILAGIPATIESKKMIEILNIIYSSNFILGYATFTAVMILLMVAINVYDYYQINKRFNDIDKKYKQLRKAGE
jgi:purine-cytosine permease-like protein